MMKTTLATTAIAVGLGVTSANATLVPYYTESSFLDALTSAPTYHNFDSATTGTIGNGTNIDGITFDSASLMAATTFGETNAELSVATGLPTTSTANFIGVTGDTLWTNGAFRDGDSVVISFATGYALGIWFQESLSDPTIQTDDTYLITVNGESEGIDADFYTGLGNNWNAWFLGVISDTPFSTATFSAPAITSASNPTGGTTLVWTADRFITTSVPAPATLALLAIGLGIFGAGRARKQRSVS
jgi:hypothetical protein